MAATVAEYATAKSLALLDTENREVLNSFDAIFTHGNTDQVAPLDEPLVFNRFGLSHISAKDTHQPKTDVDESAKADFAGAKTSVWWDIENCEVPKGCDPHGVAQSIRSVLSKSNFCGPLTIYAYGDTNQIPSSVQQALSSTGVSLNHVPAVSNGLIILYVLDDGEHLTGVKDGSDKKLLVDIMLWAMDNQAPANIMLISGDKDFSYLLHKLGMKRYNILLARPEKASTPLIAAAKTVWLWTSIFNGDCPNIPIDLTTRRHHHDSAYEVSRHLGPKQAQGTKRGRSFCELCNVSCSNHDLTAHLSGRRHRANVELVARGRPLVSNSTEPKYAWCRVCRLRFRSQASYETHILGKSHQEKLEDQNEHSKKRICRTP
ncbi:putative transcription factor C2H2 family [Arabidopsis thaliana]|uniref:U1-type domain-containing protein n=3 Tax=Arabidopsis TaxID=3701 RepID=A0A178UEC8_ARATH|nr:Putative endonuclease or glycosyl hydrolase [Arabidopsis thaliana]AED97431.2 Putative endonuclease or glycosyl hydrolase [Arabidopsis thaliana]KAG7613771.1 Zinc finger C2H2 superfamily [Arabidopsis suecica]OAO92035.1 hypothetical protein AXX17_AT5G60640 [Arabidopsis thaliana]VYS71047.1 unnamed protein product [Arabidopsis thaliana]|eukprot:NP_001318852.1 Putative endonuclease or glycosyl hydrolase [Arabidopsis thaliana]